VESLQVAAGLSNALKVYWFVTYWSRKSSKNPRRLSRRFVSDEVEKIEED